MSLSPLFIGNWKMQMNCAETAQFVALFATLIELNPTSPDVGIAPPFTSISSLSRNLSNIPGLLVGAQNAHWLDRGAHTGEISAAMLLELGVQFVICGHSERRQFYGETNETVSLRAKAAIANGLKAIVCCGESEEQYRAGQTESVITGQLVESLRGMKSEDAKNLIVAYEPIWAIGTGLSATPEVAEFVHNHIRKLLNELFGKDDGSKIRILYGGSTKPENIAELVSRDNIDGALVGGSSLTPECFSALISAGRAAKHG